MILYKVISWAKTEAGHTNLLNNLQQENCQPRLIVIECTLACIRLQYNYTVGNNMELYIICVNTSCSFPFSFSSLCTICTIAAIIILIIIYTVIVFCRTCFILHFAEITWWSWKLWRVHNNYPWELWRLCYCGPTIITFQKSLECNISCLWLCTTLSSWQWYWDRWAVWIEYMTNYSYM